MKKVLSLVLVATMLFSIFAGLQISSSAVEPEGKCGKNVNYTFDKAKGTLTISGSGDMYNYSNYVDDDYKGSPFYFDYGVKSVVIENGVTSIGSAMFFYCREIESVTIPDSVKSIGASAFEYCSSLKSVTVPNSVTTIGDLAFSGCSSLESVTLGKCVTVIGNSAFAECTALTSISVPDSVTDIGIGAFERCTALKSVHFGNSLKTIGNWAFDSCPITQLFIPASVTSISDKAFFNCTKLESIKVDENNSTYDSRNNCNALIESGTNKLICGCGNSVIEDTVTSIGGRAFYGCDTLEYIIVPESVTSIGQEAFENCSALKGVVLPSSVRTINAYTFYGCTSLKSIIFCATQVWEYAFFSCNNLENVYYRNNYDLFENSEILEGNACLTNAKFHYNYDENIAHSYTAVTVNPTANALGYTQYKCSCGEYQKDSKGHIYKENFKSPIKPITFKCVARTAAAEKFTWSKVSGVTGYQVQLLTVSGKNAALKTTVANSYVFTKLVSGYAYKARIRYYIKTTNGNVYLSQWITINSPTLPKGTSLSKVTPAKRAFTAQWKVNKTVTGYQLQYATNNKFTSAKLKAVKGASKAKLAISSLKGGTKYFVRIRTFKTVGGKNYYSAWSGAKSVKTK